MGSRHACHRSARRQRFFDDPPLLLHAAESPLRLSTSHLYGWLRDVHDSSWTRSSCPQKPSSVRSLTISRRYKSDAYARSTYSSFCPACYLRLPSVCGTRRNSTPSDLSRRFLVAAIQSIPLQCVILW